jgi:hypothetical protein
MVIGLQDRLFRKPCNASNLGINQKPDDAGRHRFQGKQGHVAVFIEFCCLETPLKNRVYACG